MKNTKAKNSLRYICEASAIAALYVVITIAIGPLGNAAIQCRIPEAFCVLAIFTPAAIPGMTIGCLISNVATGCLWQDVLFGTLATLIGVIGARMLRRIWWLTPLCPPLWLTRSLSPLCWRMHTMPRRAFRL